MKYKIIIIVVIALIVAIDLFLYFKRVAPLANQAPANLRTLKNIFDDRSSNKPVSDDKITIPTDSGDIVINDVFKNAQLVSTQNYQTYNISGEVSYTAGGGGEGFTVTTKGNNSDLLGAEQRFINLLGASQADACRLSVQEYLVDASGMSSYVRSSLSFCK